MIANLDWGDSGWAKILPDRKPHSPLEGDISADVLIIGGGVAGLSAARELQKIDADLSVALLEAKAIADGPAGRNSGFMIDLPHDLSTSDYLGNRHTSQYEISLNRQAIAFAQAAQVDFDMPHVALKMLGKINAATSTKNHQHNLKYADHLSQINEPFELYDAAKMQQICGTDYYQGGIYTGGTAILQPAMYIRALADGLVKNGLQLFENTSVRTLKKDGQAWLASSLHGQIRAKKVILAVNGTIENFGFYKRHLVHVILFGSMTRKLTTAEVDLVGGEQEWAITPAHVLGTSVRKFKDGNDTRMLIRNRSIYHPHAIASKRQFDQVRRDHLRSFTARFGMISHVEMAYSWSGRLCLSRNSVQVLDELDTGLFAACCQNGLGLSKGTLAGIVAAQRVAGRLDVLFADYLQQASPIKLPPEPLMHIGANGYLRFNEWQAKAEL